MRKLYLLATAMILAFASFTKGNAQTAIEGSPKDIDFSAEGNYVLFSTQEGVTKVDMSVNGDTPFGYYQRDKNGNYSKFQNHNASNKGGSIGWYNSGGNWLYILDNGEIHPLDANNGYSPAVLFTAPEDGWYYVGMTFNRKSTSNNSKARYFYIKNNFVTGDKDNNVITSLRYGENTDNQVVDYFVKLHKGDRISTVQTVEDANSSAGTVFSRYVIAAYTTAGTTISDEFVANSGLNSYNPRAQKEIFPEQGNVAIRVPGTDKYLVRKNKASGRDFYYAAFRTLDELKSGSSDKGLATEEFEWEFDLVENTNGGYNLKFGEGVVVSDGYVSESANADDHTFRFFVLADAESNIAIQRKDGKYWNDNFSWNSPYDKVSTSDDSKYLFEICKAPAASPYEFFNFGLKEDGEDNTTAISNRTGKKVNVALTRTLSSEYWNTFCVPFAISAETITDKFGAGTTITEFKSVDGTTMVFEAAEAIEAGKPYLIKPGQNVVNPEFPDVTISAAALAPVTVDGYSFTGVYGPTEIKTDGTDLFVTTTGGLSKPAEGKSTMKGLRAFITIPSGAQAKLSILGETTAVDKIDVAEANDNGAVYNISGQRVSDNAKGIVVKNGKKIVIK